MSSADDRVGAGGTSTSSAAEDDPPRSRLFVVCPKGTGQETLTRAFEDLLTRLSDPGGTSRSNPKKDGERDGDDEKGPAEGDARPNGDAAALNPNPKLLKHLESVRAVPHKGVAFAKFSNASTAALCMRAIADANGVLGTLKVKCMLAEPKAGTTTTTTPSTNPDRTEVHKDGVDRGGGEERGGSSRPRGERAGDPGGSASPKRARRGERAGAAKFPPAPHEGSIVRVHASPASSVESGGVAGRGGDRSTTMPVNAAFSPPVPPGPPPRKRNDDAGSIPTPPGSHHHPPPLPMHPPPPTTAGGAESTHGGEQIFLGEAWMGDGRRGALIFHPQSHPQTQQAPMLPMPTQWNPGLHPHPPLVPTYGVNTQLPANYHPYVPVRQSPSPANSARSGMSGGGNGNNTANNAGARVPRPSTSADSGSVRSGGGGGCARSVGNGVPTRRAFVVLDKSVTQAQLQSAFRGRCEGVESVELKVELESGRSRGFAYVTFDTHSAMSSACELLNGTELPEGGGTRCKVMPAEDKTYGGGGGNSNKRRGSNTPVTSSGGTDRSALTKLGPIAHTSDSAETDTRGGNPDQGLTPSPDSEFEVKKKTSLKKEDPQRDPKDDGTLRRQREEGDDDDVLSGQLPGPRKYSRLNSPSAERENGGESDDGTDVDTEDVETEDGPEAASRPRRVNSTTTNRRTKAEEEATDAAMALGKVTLGVVAEEDPLEETEENAEENKEQHEAEEGDDDEAPEDTEGPKDKKLAGVNTDSKPSECDDESPVETTAVTTAITSTSTLFFRLALPLPSYALRHVLASHGPLVDLAMSVDGASGTVRYVDEDGASAALEALHATEILGIELRMSRRESELGVSKGTGTTLNADQRKKRTRRA